MFGQSVLDGNVSEAATTTTTTTTATENITDIIEQQQQQNHYNQNIVVTSDSSSSSSFDNHINNNNIKTQDQSFHHNHNHNQQRKPQQQQQRQRQQKDHSSLVSTTTTSFTNNNNNNDDDDDVGNDLAVNVIASSSSSSITSTITTTTTTTTTAEIVKNIQQPPPSLSSSITTTTTTSSFLLSSSSLPLPSYYCSTNLFTNNIAQQQQPITTLSPSSTFSYKNNNNSTSKFLSPSPSSSSSSHQSVKRSILYEHLLKELSPTPLASSSNALQNHSNLNINNNNNETFEFFLPISSASSSSFLNNNKPNSVQNDQYLSIINDTKKSTKRKTQRKQKQHQQQQQQRNNNRSSMKNRVNRNNKNSDGLINNNSNSGRNKRKSKKQELLLQQQQQQEDSILESLPIQVVAALLLNQQQQQQHHHHQHNNLTATTNLDQNNSLFLSNSSNLNNFIIGNDINSIGTSSSSTTTTTTTTLTTTTTNTKTIVSDNIKELIKIDNIMNLSTKQSPMPIALTTKTTANNSNKNNNNNSNEDDSSIPLNLCVKKSSSSSSSTSSSSLSSNNSNNNNNVSSLQHNNFGSNNNKLHLHHQHHHHQQQLQQPDSHTLNLVKNLAQLQQQQNSQQQLQFNNSLLSQQQQQHQQPQQQQKKRGRKPKSTLMAYGDPQPHPTQTHHQPLLQQQQTPPTLPLPDFSGFGNLLAAFNQQQAHLQQQQQQQQQQPRKRGRPPTLSPPHNAHQNSLANSKLATNQQATSAFHQNTYPFNLFNTPAANDGIIPNFPGLNALSLAAAAALAGGGQLANHQLFNNAVNQFSILQKLNPNLLNANLFANLKNPMELAAAAAAVTANSNDIVNNKHSSASSSSSSSSKFVDPALLLQKELNDQMQANFLSSLPAAVAKNLIGDQSGGSNTSMNKSSFAHKSNSSDKQLRISLNHGFQRFTYITGFSKSGTIEGDVIYIAPCKKKIKSYQDLIKYLSKNNVVNLSRENFSFDPNVIIGQFIPNIAQLPSDVILSENQMKVHLEELSKIRNLDLSATSITAVPPQQTIAQSNQNNSSSNHIIPEKKKRVRDSGGTRNVYDSIKGFNTRSKTAAVVHQNNDIKNNELEPSVTITIQNPMVTPAPIRGTKRKSTERHETARNEKLLKKQQEELERKQRELKEKEEEELRKIKENQEKLLELQKQEQLKISAEIEHERVSQHQMFIHALNELKSSEDRDSKKEELSSEKVALQERKLLKRVLEVELLKELKKPVEDMMLKDHKNLPIFNRIPGQKLTGKAFADLLMVYEFLYNFGETIGFDVDSLPTLNSLMMALLNLDSEAEEELMSIVNHLVICAIEDPGMPNNMTTLMGQKLKDATVTEHNVTEILRLYFLAFSNAVREEDEPNRVECKIHERLCSGISFIALDAIVKLDILVFLCNELLCNQAIVKQIDDSIESVTVFKKDKWGIENDIRKFRLVKMRRERIIEEEKAKQLLLQQEKDNANTNQSATTMAENGGENNVTNTGENTTGTGENSTVISDNDESNTNVSAATLSNSVTTINLPPIEFDDDVNMTNEEIDKKIERLNKQCNQMNNKMHKALNAYRVFPLGQDRYRRTYWVLPNCGGVFVEGMESGEPEELANNVWTEEEIEMENALKNAINDEPMEDLTTGDGEIKSELDKQSMNGDNDVEQTDTMSIKEENDDRDNAYKDVPSTDDEKKPIVDGQQVKPEMEPKMEKDDALKTESNENEMTTTNQMDKKDELSESEQIDVNNAQQIDHITVDDVRWFDLDLDFECDQSVEPPPIIDESTTVEEKDDEETAEEKETNEQEKDDQNQENKKEEEDDDEEEEEIAEIKEEPMSEMERALTTFMSQDTLDCLFKRTEMNIDCAILKDCLLRILSSFARSATITKFPNSEVIETDIIVCPTLQKRIQLWKVLQYETPRKVPREYQFGWWRITDGAQLKSMIELLHSNALREKNLQKHLIKHLNYATISCRNSIANLDVSDYDRDASDWREFGAPTENRCPHRSCMGKNYCHEVALRKDLQVLELIEAFEEKILSCSMQIRNWKPSNKLSSADFKSKLNQNKSSKTNKNGKNRKNHKNNNNHNENSDCSNDSIQENGTNGCTLVISTENNGDYDLLRVQKEKLLEIEATIERRYLKPPLGFKNNQALQFTTDNGNGGDDYNEYANDDNATAGLIRWRDAAREAKCCSQIAMGLHFLENCIAWDKSIMRANTIDKVCIVCGKKGKLLNCDTCAKAFHPNCIDPPVNKQIKGRWICHMCMRKNKRNSSSKSSKKSSSKESSSANDDRNHDSNIMGNNSNTRESSSKRMSNGNAKDKGEKETANKKERKPKKKQDKEKDN
ncbi:uncharacterized protein LOC124500623 [Dermatophagoides farinae]|uniref:uncharacterized protein LOC124500623 n=1 Tax=Dermatophagoides farinae TaxID=6954 RepID=UPI003F61D13A